MNRVFCKDHPPNFLKLCPQKINEDKGFQYIFPKLGVLFPQLKTQKSKRAIHSCLSGNSIFALHQMITFTIFEHPVSWKKAVMKNHLVWRINPRCWMVYAIPHRSCKTLMFFLKYLQLYSAPTIRLVQS